MTAATQSRLQPNRRQILAAGGALACAAGFGPRAVAAPRPSHILAPAAYGDETFLAALGKLAGASFDHQMLDGDDAAVDALRPLGPTASASQIRARPGLVVTAHPWARGILWPEGVIDALAKQVSPTTIELAPGLVPSLSDLETGLEGRYFLGRAMAFDMAAMVVDRRRVSVDAVGDFGLGILDDPALRGRYAVVDDRRSLLAMAMLYAGLDPFRLQRPSELRRFEPALRQLVARAAVVVPTAAEAIAAIADGRADLALPAGLGAMAPARLSGQGHLALALPGVGPLGGRAAFYWVEMMTVVTQAPAEMKAAMAAAEDSDAVLALARAGGGLRPVAGLALPAIAEKLAPEERSALDLDLLPGFLARCAPMGLVAERRRLAPLLAEVLAGPAADPAQ
ncbi:hypothetical protein L2U69_04865 [Zavarzinia compransoris]|uniref:hypothetical protein n=1 Tax=Zavarzinia marina TaxID=2911065 RepID=UPI001F2E4332|nr:hypothetical protein [Zavarzinia marina]MCF4164968.1 hypothetical protein [Zavarzinia marina]